jgi:hypothetical protein
MLELLFSNYNDRELARIYLTEFAGEEICPTDNPDVTFKNENGEIIHAKDLRQKGFPWLFKKLRGFKTNCVLEMLTKVRALDEKYFEEIDLAIAKVGPRAVQPKDVIPGASSCRSTYSEQQVYLETLENAEARHRQGMEKINVYFKIGTFLLNLSSVLAGGNPMYEKLIAQLYNGRKVGEILERVNYDDDLIELREELGCFRNNKDSIKTVNHMIEYKTQRKCEGTIKMPELTDEEVETILNFTFPNNSSLSEKSKKIYRYYFKNNINTNKIREMNATIWEHLLEAGHDIHALDAKNKLRLPTSKQDIFTGYYHSSPNNK